MKERATKPEQCLTALTPVNLGNRLAKATAAIFTSVNVDKWQHKATTTDLRMIVNARINLDSMLMVVRVAMLFDTAAKTVASSTFLVNNKIQMQAI